MVFLFYLVAELLPIAAVLILFRKQDTRKAAPDVDVGLYHMRFETEDYGNDNGFFVEQYTNL
jgi:hypothetical protein